MASKQTSLRGFLKTMTEEDRRQEFKKLTLNLKREATKKAASEAFEVPAPLVPNDQLEGLAKYNRKCPC